MIAVQYILYILFPDFDVAQNIFYYFRFKRFHDQWNLNLCTTTIFSANAIWFAMPIYGIACIYFVVVKMHKFTKELPREDLVTA